MRKNTNSTSLPLNIPGMAPETLRHPSLSCLDITTTLGNLRAPHSSMMYLVTLQHSRNIGLITLIFYPLLTSNTNPLASDNTTTKSIHRLMATWIHTRKRSGSGITTKYTWIVHMCLGYTTTMLPGISVTYKKTSSFLTTEITMEIICNKRPRPKIMVARNCHTSSY